MNKFRLNINGKEVTGVAGQTILEVARENDIFIPTLCYDERTKIYGSCGLCMCEVEGNPKLCKACATEIAPGIDVQKDVIDQMGFVPEIAEDLKEMDARIFREEKMNIYNEFINQ